MPPHEVRAMSFDDARGLFDYWRLYPPENESLCVLAQAYTDWRPQGPMTEEETIAQHRRSLEQRWKAGAMNPKQLYEAMGGGRLSAPGPAQMPGMISTGIGEWPPKFPGVR